jgi:4'-phosphopantetheinyl transferase
MVALRSRRIKTGPPPQGTRQEVLGAFGAIADAPQPADGEIHVWNVDLRGYNRISSELFAFLSEEEQARVERFHFLHDRETYSICRGALRHILGMYLGVKPEEVKFSQDANGKPQLGELFSTVALQFNVSHSKGLGLIAVARGMNVGVDIEWVRPIPGAEGIAQAHFSTKERDCLARLSDSQFTEGFISCWTRKEAYIKALGGGLSIPLNGFCVATQAGEVVECHGTGGSSKLTRIWKVMDLRFEEVGSREVYLGALVGAGSKWHATVRKWQPPSHLLFSIVRQS